MFTAGDITLKPEQEMALAILNDGNILVGGVGSGKTFTGIAWYIKNHSDKPLIVITTAANRDMVKPGHEKSDWAESLELCGVADYTIDSWNNITKYKDYKNSCFLFDEQRAIGYGTWGQTFIRIARFNENNSWIMLSATPGDTWMDYIPIFIANGFFRNKSEFIRQHVIYKSYLKFPVVDRFVNEDILYQFRQSIQVKMKVERHTLRHRDYIYCDYDKNKLHRLITERFNVDEDRPVLNNSELIQLIRKTVNTSPDRIKTAREIIKYSDKLIIFYNYIYEKDILINIAHDLDITYGEWNGQKHTEIPQTDKWIYLVQYTSGSEGWNCIETDKILFYSVNYAYRKMEQAEGRIDRLNTPYVDLHYYMLTSDSLIDQSILKSVNNKQTFNEIKFMKEEFGDGA